VGTAVEVTPIREVDGKLIGSGEPGPVTRAVQQAFFEATAGREPRYQDWLCLVAQRLAKA